MNLHFSPAAYRRHLRNSFWHISARGQCLARNLGLFLLIPLPPKVHFSTPPLQLLCNQILRDAWGTVLLLSKWNNQTSSTQFLDCLVFTIHPQSHFSVDITTDSCPLKGEAFAAGGTQRLQGHCLECGFLPQGAKFNSAWDAPRRSGRR